MFVVEHDERGGDGLAVIGGDQGAVEDHVRVPGGLGSQQRPRSDGFRAASTVMASSR